MDNAETHGDSVAIGAEGERERSRMRLDGCERGRIRGSVELKDNDIGAGIAPRQRALKLLPSPRMTLAS